MSAGVFVVTIVKYLAAANDWKNLVFLVKMDKRPSFTYSYKDVEGKRIAIVSEIENSLNETKSAIQKWALVDITDHFVWDVLAFDRTKRPGLSDYFRGFLGVTERQQDSALTRSAHTSVKQWAKKIPADKLPPGEDANTYAGRSLNYLNDHDTFDTEAYLNAVVRDDNELRKSELINSLREELIQIGIAGQQFRPKPESLPKAARKQVYLTAEGVTITYEGDNETAGITVEDMGHGRKLIKIQTNRLDTKG